MSGYNGDVRHPIHHPGGIVKTESGAPVGVTLRAAPADGRAPDRVGQRPRPGGRAGRLWQGTVRALLRVPLFYKILIANTLLVVGGLIASAAITASVVRSPQDGNTFETIALLALAGALLTVMINAAILKLALKPLYLLEAAVARIREGELETRAPISPLADSDFERLTRTINAMLDGLATTRERLRYVAARALQAQEAERKRIARDLHDETAQALAALLIRLRVARGLTDPAARESVLEEVRTQVSAALDGVRRFARGLRPPALDELGLVAAVESHARSLAETTGLDVEVEAESVDSLLEPDAELALYRIIQEALSNVVRHAEATRANVRIQRRADRVTATVVDDGKGFSVPEVTADRQRGLGLFGMQERAALLSGRVRVRSAPGAGTSVEVDVPVARRNAPQS